MSPSNRSGSLGLGGRLALVAQDLRYGLRQLARSPAFTAVAVLSLALGVGANAAIFSLVEQVLLRTLPVHEPDRLVNLSAPGHKPGILAGGPEGTHEDIFSYPMFRDLEAGQQVFTGIAAHRQFWSGLTIGDESFSGSGALVSGSYFPVLGLRPALGRLLGPDDDRVPGAERVAVLGHRFWETRLGADPDVLGRTITVAGHPLVIVGVAPAGFEGVTFGTDTDLFVPITLREVLTPFFGPTFENRLNYWAYLFARLQPGMSMGRASEAINTIYRPIIQDVEAPLQPQMSAGQMEAFLSRAVVLEDGRRGRSVYQANARMPILLLFGVTGVVLLITCANIANLLLARGARRAQEFAVRVSLGARRSRLLVQLLTESLLLAVLGGAAGILVATGTLSLIGSWLPTQTAANLDLSLQPPVLLWTGALALGTGLLFGLYPALHFTRPGLIGVLRSGGGQGAGRSSTRVRSALVTVQIALSMALLISAGLFARSLHETSRVDVGANIDDLATFSVYLNPSEYDASAARGILERIEEELAAVPGAVVVTAAQVPILVGNTWLNSVSVEGYAWEPGMPSTSAFNNIGPDYFRTLQTPILAGREFTASDVQGAPRVAIVNEAFAREFGLDPRSAVGRRMEIGRGEIDLGIEIVGLVADVRYADIKDAAPPTYYLPWRQQDMQGLTFYVRTAIDPTALLPTIRAAVDRVDPGRGVQGLTPLSQQVRDRLYMDRVISGLTAGFAVLATLLAAMGLFGVMGYTVARRTREIGLRMALGAQATRVRAMILGHVTRLLIVGGVIGIVAALVAGRLVQSLLFGIEGHDPAVVLISAVLLAVVALAAGYLPARRASKVDPMIALREE